MRTPGNQYVSHIPYSNEAILGPRVEKKPLTVNYNFPGYLYATKATVDPTTGRLQKNHLFYRERTTPGLWAPIIMPIVISYASGDPSIEVLNEDKNKLGTGAGNLLHFWDNDAAIFASGTNDRNRYVTAVGADDSGDGGSGNAELTIDTAITYTPEATVDGVIAALDSGIVDIANYVLVDEEIDFRSTAKPAAISADFAIDGIYGARVNYNYIAGYDLFPAAFKTALRDNILGLIFDTPQI